MSEALHAQIMGAGYQFGDAVTKQKKSWAMLNPEQQAKLIDQAYVNGYFTSGKWSNSAPVPDGGGGYVSAQILTNYMNQVRPQLLGGQRAT